MSSLHPSNRARAVAESVTLAITAKASALRAAGADVVSLSAGEPDFPTPPAAKNAGIAAIENDLTRYTATSGLPELRRAACSWFAREFGLEYEPAEVMATAGAKAALHMALMTILEPGDRVLVLAPYWVSYPDLIRVAGGTPVVLPPVPDAGFIHSGAEIAAAAREHGARGILLNFPTNPSGAVPSQSQVRSLVEAATADNLWIISDEIYAKLIYDGEHYSPALFDRERTIVVNGGTKSHSFTGWRLAYMAGPSDIVAAAGRIQSQVLGNPSSIAQRAAIAVCEGNFDEDQRMRMTAFDQRRRFLVTEINTIDGLSLAPPQGAFYALVDARPLCEQRGIDDVQLATELLNQERLAVVPGSAFAIPGFIRLSYAASMETITEGVARLRGYAAR